MPELLSLDDHIGLLDAFDDADQNLKDLVYERLQSRSEFDPQTECSIYTGFWEENGQAKVRVGGRVYVLSRVAAWIFFAGFRIYGDNRAVRTCQSPACWNMEHLVILADQAAAMNHQRSQGRLGNSTHRLSRDAAEEIRKQAKELETVTPAAMEEMARKNGVRVPAIRQILLGRTWPTKEG